MVDANPTGLPEMQRYVIGFLGHLKTPGRAIHNTSEEFKTLIELSKFDPPYVTQVMHQGEPSWALTPRGQEAFDLHISHEEVRSRIQISIDPHDHKNKCG
jgi:hypothetical protein